MTCACDCSSSARRPRRALPLLVVSALVFLALGGTAFAAGSLARNSVGSAQIKSNAVKTAELNPSAVTSAKIKNGTVTGADVATGTFGGRELADGSLTGADLADGTVNGGDLTDGSVTGVDLADGSVIGDDLADASIGGRKLAGSSIGMQAIEPLTQKSLIDVPTTQVLPTRTTDLGLNLNPQSVLQWTVTKEHEGVDILQAQVAIRIKKAMSVSCEIAVDGIVATRVHQTVARTDLISDYTTVPLMTTATLKTGASVAVRCDANQPNFASAVVVGADNDAVKPTTLIATRVAR